MTEFEKISRDLHSPHYTAADMRKAFVAGSAWATENEPDELDLAEALRRWPDKEEK
jgi:hypothetical protein